MTSMFDGMFRMFGSSSPRASSTGDLDTDIVLVGDTVFDDFCWCEDHCLSLESSLQSAFSFSSKVRNLSLDLCTAHDLLHGFAADKYYMEERAKCGLRVLHSPGGELRPLEALRSHSGTGDKSLLVCLSLGSVDIRQHLDVAKPDLIIDSLRKSGFEVDYAAVVDAILALKPTTLILVFPFEFHESLRDDMLLFSREDLVEVYSYAFNAVAKVASKRGLPVIDLSRVLHPFERAHYGATCFEPSPVGGQLMAAVIAHVSKKHHFRDARKPPPDDVSTHSKIYYGTEDSVLGLEVEENTKKNRLRYVAQLLKIKGKGVGDSDMGLLADLFGEDSAIDQIDFDADDFLQNMFSSEVSAQAKDEEKTEDFVAPVPFGPVFGPKTSRSRR